MKRSEMLNKMADIIHLHRRATEGVTSDELALFVLDMQEKEGVLPPLTRNSKGNTLQYSHKWDSEDEKK